MTRNALRRGACASPDLTFLTQHNTTSALDALHVRLNLPKGIFSVAILDSQVMQLVFSHPRCLYSRHTRGNKTFILRQSIYFYKVAYS